MRRFLLAFLLAFAALVAPVAAGKPVPTGAAPAVSGDVAISASSQVIYGGHLDVAATVTGKLAPKSDLYATVVVVQDGTVVYQWSAAPPFSFPLVQQDGLKALGLIWDPTLPASGSVSLQYRTTNGGVTITTLDVETFAVPGA